MSTVLACPTCHQPIAGERCDCGATWPIADGLQDFAPNLVIQRGLAQRFMESRAVVRVYERAFRPVLTRLVTDITYVDEARFLGEHVRGGPALDIACGTGRYSRWLAQRLGPTAVTGLDLSRPMLRRAGQMAPGIRFVRGSALSLPVATDALGTATCFGALHLFPDPGLAIREIGRALGPGGRFVGLTAVAAPRWRQVQQRVGRRITLRFAEQDDLRRWCDAAGLEVIAWEPRGGMLLFATEAR